MRTRISRPIGVGKLCSLEEWNPHVRTFSERLKTLCVRKLGVLVVANPTHLTLGPLSVSRFGAAATLGRQPIHSLMNAGIPTVIGLGRRDKSVPEYHASQHVSDASQRSYDA